MVCYACYCVYVSVLINQFDFVGGLDLMGGLSGLYVWVRCGL